MCRRIGVLVIVGSLLSASLGAAQPSPGNRDVAAELLRVMQVQRDIARSTELMVDLTLRQSSELLPYRDVLVEWAAAVMSWEVVSPALVELYSRTFTVPEMRDMIAFYRTPTGQRVVAEWTALQEKQAALGMELANARAPELHRRIEERRQQLERSTGSAGAGGSGGSRETLNALRLAGTAMMSWQTDALSAAEPSRAQLDAATAAGESNAIDWALCPAITYDDLQALLVDTYLAELPRRDGWGHEIEYCLDRENPWSSRYAIGARSPGKDGRFERGPYELEPFDPSEVDRDVVWLDGLFVRWPQSSR